MKQEVGVCDESGTLLGRKVVTSKRRLWFGIHGARNQEEGHVELEGESD